MFQTPLAAQVIFVLGILNLALALLIVVSCRCIPVWRLTRRLNLMNKPSYKSFYKYHCYLWWVFWPSVTVHVIFAVGRLGFPF
ncbi:MAG: hypothetical protein HYX96_04360 [Chloroflexi bacterium]|nr:hypothetical protein [Chloroflexota bacterium]